MKPSRFEHNAGLEAQYLGVILLLRVDDFWKALDEDADTPARVLSFPCPSVGERRTAKFPHTHLDRFLPALVKAGFRVATCAPRR